MAVWHPKQSVLFRCFKKTSCNSVHKILRMDHTQNKFTSLKYISLQSIIILPTPRLASPTVPLQGRADEKQTTKPSVNIVSLRDEIRSWDFSNMKQEFKLFHPEVSVLLQILKINLLIIICDQETRQDRWKL
jgi:hypothetical protein